MTTDVLPGLLIQTVAESVRRAAAEPPDRAIRPRDFAALARYCDYMLREAEAVHADLADLLAEGVEAGAFRRRCEAELESIGRALEVTANVLRLAARVTATPAGAVTTARSVEGLERVRQGLSDIRASFFHYLDVLNRPRPAIDWMKLADEAQSDRLAGRYVRYENFEELARDLTGGD